MSYDTFLTRLGEHYFSFQGSFVHTEYMQREKKKGKGKGKGISTVFKLWACASYSTTLYGVVYTLFVQGRYTDYEQGFQIHPHTVYSPEPCSSPVSSSTVRCMDLTCTM